MDFNFKLIDVQEWNNLNSNIEKLLNKQEEVIKELAEFRKMQTGKIYTLAEAAEKVGEKVQTLRKYTKPNKEGSRYYLKPIKTAGKIKIHEADLEDYLNRCRGNRAA